jgi:hypothetical protein
MSNTANNLGHNSSAPHIQQNLLFPPKLVTPLCSTRENTAVNVEFLFSAICIGQDT